MSDPNTPQAIPVLTPEQQTQLEQAVSTGSDLLSVWDTMEKLGAKFPFTKDQFANVHSFIQKTLDTFGQKKS